MELIIIRPRDKAQASARFDRIQEVVADALGQGNALWIDTAADLEKKISEGTLKGQRLLFLIPLGEDGINLEWYAMLKLFRTQTDCLKDSWAGIIIDGNTEYWTKAAARELALTINEAGCGLIGRPLCEATGSLQNYLVLSEVQNVSLLEAYQNRVRELVMHLMSFRAHEKRRSSILCIHSCNQETSNTWRLWEMVKERLPQKVDIQEISLRRKVVEDCAGCSFDTCMYFSRRQSCFYGGTIVSEVYPALEKSDALMVLSPNYNDAMGANLVAFVNRLTALYRKKPFSDKYLFSIIVSGYSGGDIVAQQLLGSLCMNKSFILPPHFSLKETGMHPGSVEAIDIDRRAAVFAKSMAESMGWKKENPLTGENIWLQN